MRTHQACCCFFRDTCFKEPPCLAADGTTAMGKMTRFRKASTYEIRHQHTCIYYPTPSRIHTPVVCTAMITPLDLLIHESSSSQVGLRPVMSVILSCPLIFPACLSYIDCLVVPDRGGLGSFDTEKFVCLSVWSAEVTQQYVCLLGQLNPLTEQAGEEK